jgi:hypothetical protein
LDPNNFDHELEEWYDEQETILGDEWEDWGELDQWGHNRLERYADESLADAIDIGFDETE